MAQFCIPRNAMKDVVKEIKGLGENRMQKLAAMSKKERMDMFRKHMPDSSAEILNTKFEKAIMSEKIASLGRWVKDNLDTKYRDEFSEKALERRFKSLKELDDYIDANAENFVLQKSKIALTGKEIKEFTRLGKELLKAQKDLGDNVGDIVGNFEKNLEYAKRLSKIEDYSVGISPQSKWKTFTSNTGKAMMLASFKSPLLNVISNTVSGTNEAIIRRITNGRIGGKVQGKLMKDYIKNSLKIYKETGVDFTRMLSLDDKVTGVGKLLGESMAVPRSKAGRAFSDIVFKYSLGYPDVAFSAVHTVDSMNLTATRLAKGESSKASEIFLDAVRLEPKTKEGRMVKEQAMADALYATFTNDSKTAEVTKSIKDFLNKAGVGDILIPFAKTPSNVVEANLDYAGLGAIKGLKRLFESMYRKEEITNEAAQEILRGIFRSGLGLTAAYVMYQWIKPEDFMGAYDPDRQGIDQLKNGAYNAVKIGDKWVSVDYFGPLGTPLVGMMYAKKYGKDDKTRLGAYGNGMLNNYLKAPGFEPLYTGTKNAFKAEGDGVGSAIAKLPQEVTMEISSRLFPGIMYDIAKAMDDVQRDTSLKKYTLNVGIGEVNLDKFAVKIPYLRETLKPKHSSLGQVMLEENSFNSLLFGARVRTARQDAVIDEFTRLTDSGNKPNMKDMRFMNSSKVEELKKKVGQDKFYEITKTFGEELARRSEKQIKSNQYQKLSDEGKKELINDLSSKLYEETLKKNGIKYR